MKFYKISVDFNSRTKDAMKNYRWTERRNEWSSWNTNAGWQKNKI